MSYLVLARKFRPQTFEDVIAQGHVTRTLSNAITSGRVAHAILFSGPRGTGKTTVARILAKAMNCQNGPTPTPCNVCRSCREITSGHSVDVYEIDGASNNSVDQVRELRDNIKYMPAHSPYKIYIIDEVHMLSTAAFNALLKTLEEPPSHILFLFATTEPHKIPITILSRCQRHDLRRIDLKAVVEHLAKLCETEAVKFPLESLWLIARESGGSMRDALSLLDQMISCADGPVRHEQVLDLLGAVDNRTLFEISRAAIARDIPELLRILDDSYARGRDLKKLYTDLVGHFRNLLVIKVAAHPAGLVDLSTQEIETARTQIQTVSHTELTQLLDMLMKEDQAIRFSVQPRLTLEMAFIRLGILKPALPMEQLIEGLERLRQDFYKSPVVLSGPVGIPPVRNSPKPVSMTADSPRETVGIDISKDSVAAIDAVIPESGDTPESLDRAWRNILNRMAAEHPALTAALSESRAVAISENLLTVEVTGSEFNVNMAQREKSRGILKEVCGGYFGRPLQIEIAATVSNNQDNQIKREAESQLRNEALHHPMVDTIIDTFNGKVLDVKLL